MTTSEIADVLSLKEGQNQKNLSIFSTLVHDFADSYVGATGYRTQLFIGQALPFVQSSKKKVRDLMLGTSCSGFKYKETTLSSRK